MQNRRIKVITLKGANFANINSKENLIFSYESKTDEDFFFDELKDKIEQAYDGEKINLKIQMMDKSKFDKSQEIE